MDLKRIGNGAHYSEVIDYNGILYLSGQVNVNTHEIRSQSKAIFAEIDRLLAENDSDKEHILFVTLYLSDAANFEGMNAEWDACLYCHWYGCPWHPARSRCDRCEKVNRRLFIQLQKNRYLK